MSKKKPFKETGVGKFLIEKAPSILGIVGDAILPGNVISELISGNKDGIYTIHWTLSLDFFL